MRYEDASGSISGSAGLPDARDDADTIPAGGHGPATGNVITGAGTISGKAGADTPGTAEVVALRGAGGADSSDDGSALHVQGRYGVLNLDAKGNYRYVPEANAPDNVLDLFQYTIANRGGGRDTADLAITLGDGSVKVGENAQQVIPGPDGIITLPPGVDLSDVHVVGRDLVINLPNGGQMVIVNGAVFVPQLVLGGVEVPPANLAALLIEAEPRPASGTPQSSGGNFADPVPPLDPGVPLGDLIPPTELAFPEPIFEEIFDLLDEETEAGVATAQLDDDAQAGGIPGGIGDDPGGSSFSGVLPGSGGDGDLVWALLTTGAPSGFTYVAGPGGSILVQQVQGSVTVTVLTITVDSDSGEFTVVQNAAIRHAPGADENNAIFTVSYTVSDDDGDTAVGTLTINVDDDTPQVSVTAGPDGAVLLTTDDAQTIGVASDTAASTANFSGVFGSSSSAAGADGAGSGTTASYALSTTGGASGLTQGGVVINLYNIGGVIVGSTSGTAPASTSDASVVFTVSVDSSGIVTLTQLSAIDHTNPDPTPTGTPFADHVISLADGAITLTRSVTVIDNDGDPGTGTASVGIGANLQFTDDGPVAVNDGSRGSFDDNVAGVTIGTVAGLLANDNFGADGQGSPAITIGTGSLGGTISIVGGNLVYTSAHNVPPGGSAVETFTYTIRDADGDTATATFTVTLTDTGPTIDQVAATIEVDEEGLSGGLAGTVYGDGSDLAGTAVTQSGTLSGLSFGGDGAGDIVLAAVADTGLRTLSNQVVKSAWNAATHTLTGFVDTNGNGVVDGGETQVFTLQITNVATGAYSFTLLQPVKHATANTEDNATFSVGVTVTDAEGDPANGSISILIDDDSPNAANDGNLASVDDGASGVTIGTVAGILGNDAYGADGQGSPAITIATGSLGGTISIVGGNLVYTSNHNVAPGGSAVETFTYTIVDGDGDTDTATFTVTLTDTGPTIDQAAASIAVDEEGLAGGIAGTVYVDGSDLAGTATTATGNLSGLSFGGDGPGDIVLAAVADTGLRTLSNQVIATSWNGGTHTLTGFADANGNGTQDGGEATVFTLQITNVGTGAYSFQLFQPVKHATADTEDNATFNVGVTVTDSEGDPASGSISILIDDDSPNAANDGNLASVDDGASGVTIGTVAGLLANDGFGADGQGSPAITIATGSLGGTVSIVAGQLVYTSAHNVPPGGSAVETFTYTIYDGDGDTDTATFTVTLTDEGPTIDRTAATIEVDEEGLAGGIAGTVYVDGSDLAGTATTATGNLSGLSFGGDGPGDIVLAAVADTGLRTLSNQVIATSWNGGTHTLTGFADANGNGTQDGGEATVFTLQITNVGTGAYSFQLFQPVKHLTADTEDNATLSVGVTVTDSEGDPASGSISILIDDDSPNAANDGNLATVDDNASGVVVGTVAGILANDGFGADGAGSPQVTIIGTGSLGGTISIVAGQLVYTSAHNVPPGGSAVETFTYSIKDGDGDTDTATFTVTLNDGGPTIDQTAATIEVDEEGLAGGIAGTVYVDGSDLAGTATTATGNLSGLSFGSDGAGDIVLTAVADTGLRTLSNQVIATSWNGGTHTLTGFADANGNGTQDGGEATVFTLQITNVGTGAYSFQLFQPVKHATADTEDNATFNVGVTVTDSEGDPASGSISILIDDDSPNAANDGNLATVDDNSSGVAVGTVAGLLANDGFGADGAGSPQITIIGTGSLGGTISIVAGQLIYTSAHNVPPAGSAVETFTYSIKDGDGDTDTATFTVTLSDTGPTINPTAASIEVDEEGIGGIAGTVYVDGSDLAGTATTATGNLAGLSFGTDGAGDIVLTAVADTGLRTLSNQVVATSWNGATHTLTGFADANGNGTQDGGEATVFTLQITNVGTGSYGFQLFQPVKHATANTEDNATFNVGVVVTDAEGDPANGSISILIDDDSPDAVNDGNIATVDDNSSGVVVGTVAGLLTNDLYGADGPAASGVVTIVGTGSLGGTITINGSGQLIYTPAHNVPPGGSAVETFTYRLTDGDTDTDTATFTVTLTDTGPSINPASAAVEVDEEGLTGGNPGTIYAGGSDLAGEDVTDSGTLAGLSFGDDGAGDIVLTAVADTGLRTLSNQVIATSWNGGTHTLTGFADANGNGTQDGGEATVFTLQITNVGTGAWSFQLFQPVKHATANTEDNATFNVGVVVTDAEGDAANGSISVLIDDDSPNNFTPQDMNDDTNATPANPEDDAIVNDGNGLETNPLNDANNDGVGENFIGADGFGSLVFTTGTHTNGELLRDAGGTALTSGGKAVYLTGWGTSTLTAYVESGTTAGYQAGQDTTVAFTISLNQGSGYGANSTYTVDFNVKLDDGSGATFKNLSGGVAGNPPFKLITEPGVATELLATPINAGSVNSDSDDIAVDSQFIDIANPDKGIRFDFGDFTYDANGGGTSDDAFVMVSHSTINGFRWTVDQISNGTTADIRLVAIDADNDGGVEEQQVNPAGDVQDPITMVKIYEVTEPSAGVFVFTLVGTFTSDGAVAGTGAFVDFEAGGSVLITDLPARYAIQTYTADGYSRIEITNAGTSGGTDGKFSLSMLSIETTDAGRAIDLSYGVTATDADGDTSTGTIDITLVPTASSTTTSSSTSFSSDSLLSTSSFDTSGFTSNGNGNGNPFKNVTTNSNPVLMGAFAAGGMMALEPLAASELAFAPASAFSVSGIQHNPSLAPIPLDSLTGPGAGDLLAQHNPVIEAIPLDNFNGTTGADIGFIQASLDSGTSAWGMQGPAAFLQGTTLAMHDQGSSAFQMAAASVAMPSAEQLAGIGQIEAGGPVQMNQIVGQVLVEALSGGEGPSLDALIDALPATGETGPAAGLDALASQFAGGVPIGDMGIFAGFTAPHAMFTMEQMAHQDAAPAHA